jgi:L-ascorbate metabolism protein UlaG (beta-lactamase superfamily)
MSRYANLDPAHRPHDLGAVFRWAVWDKMLGRRRKSPGRVPVPQLSNDGAALRSNRDRPSLTWIGHATWLVQVAGQSFLTDPVFGALLGGVLPRNVPPGVALESLPRIDGVVISHNHYDHLDRPTLLALGGDLPYFVPAGLGRWFRRLGCRRVQEMEWWQSLPIGRATVTFVPARHWSRRTPFDTNRSWWGGFVLSGGGRRVYFAGDTAYFDGFAEIGRRYAGIDAALLPIGAYDPEWFMRQQHMDPADAARAFSDLGARLFCAMHWGTFKLTDEPLDEPPSRLEDVWRDRGLDPAAKWVAAVGETRWLDEE